MLRWDSLVSPATFVNLGLSKAADELVHNLPPRVLSRALDVSTTWVKIVNFLAAGRLGGQDAQDLRLTILQFVLGAGMLTGDWSTTKFTQPVVDLDAGEALVRCIKSSRENSMTRHVADELTKKLWLVWACLVTFDKDTIPPRLNNNLARSRWQGFVTEFFQYNWPAELIYPEVSVKREESTTMDWSGTPSWASNEVSNRHTMVLRQRVQHGGASSLDRVAEGKRELKNRIQKELSDVFAEINAELGKYTQSEHPAAIPGPLGSSAQAIVTVKFHKLHQSIESAVEAHYRIPPGGTSETP